ncbi:helix-turn-helix domain-containing protein [Dactylosporangium sp. NPDC000521]|uniref:helix-turn-helix domain-containing protein n=1 Tax=Dactylosporangium sp. NPDC000521 TaxID=3363975 RepID=UPI0036B19842
MRNETDSDVRASRLRALLLPCEVAALLRCSEWWVKEQARNGFIPYVRVAGGFRFTEEHVAAIIERLEVRPAVEATPVVVVEPTRPAPVGRPVTHLRPRVPRRAQRAAEQAAAA